DPGHEEPVDVQFLVGLGWRRLAGQGFGSALPGESHREVLRGPGEHDSAPLHDDQGVFDDPARAKPRQGRANREGAHAGPGVCVCRMADSQASTSSRMMALMAAKVNCLCRAYVKGGSTK